MALFGDSDVPRWLCGRFSFVDLLLFCCFVKLLTFYLLFWLLTVVFTCKKNVYNYFYWYNFIFVDYIAKIKVVKVNISNRNQRHEIKKNLNGIKHFKYFTICVRVGKYFKYKSVLVVMKWHYIVMKHMKSVTTLGKETVRQPTESSVVD